jgi:environmental stress-induced protein Ves
MMRLLRAVDRIAQPWKNGGGVTREVAVSPQGAGFDTFDWRVSIAEVAAAGPFSRFEGIDRTLAILDGRMRLTFPGHVLELDAECAPLAFPGEALCDGTPLGGTVTDLNLMTRRGKVRGRMEHLSGTIAATGATLIVARTTTRIHIANESQILAPYDAALIDETITFSVDTMAFVLRMD